PPAIGSRAHEGLRFDPQGNLYGISERTTGAIFKFVPDRRGDLSAGQLYALRVINDPGDGTGEAVWVALDRDAVRINSDDAADRARSGPCGTGRAIRVAHRLRGRADGPVFRPEQRDAVRGHPASRGRRPGQDARRPTGVGRRRADRARATGPAPGLRLLALLPQAALRDHVLLRDA